MDHLRFKSEQTAAAYVGDELDPAAREQFELHMMSCEECVEEVESWRAIKSCLPRDGRNGRNGRSTRDAQGAWNAQAACDIHGAPTVQNGQDGEDTRAPETDPADGDARHDGRTTAAAPSELPAAPAIEPPSGRASTAPAAASQRPLPPAQPAAAAPIPPAHATMRWRVAAALAAGVLVGAAGGWFGRSAQGPSLTGDSIGFYSLPPLMRGPSDCTSVKVGPQVNLIALRVPAAAKEQQLVAVDSEGHDLAPDDYTVRMQADGSWLVRLRAESIREQGIRFEARSADGTVEPRGCVLSGSQDF